jgi:tetratricopeptide (TPR) repeat protein
MPKTLPPMTGVCLVSLLLIYQAMGSVFVNASGLAALRGTMCHRPDQSAEAQRILARAPHWGGKASEAVLARAGFRNSIWANDWVSAKSLLAAVGREGGRRDLLVAELATGGVPAAPTPALIELVTAAYTPPERYWVLGHVYERTGRLTEALVEYTMVTEAETDSARAAAVWLKIGLLDVRLARWSDAVAHLTRASELDGSLRVVAWSAMDRPLVELGRRNEAIEQRKRMLESSTAPYWRYLHLMALGALYGRQDCTPCDFDRAHDCFERASEVATSPEQRAEALRWAEKSVNRQDR